MTAGIGLTFGSSNKAYQTFRLSYPSPLFDVIEGAAPRMSRKLAVDLGSGTGLSLPPLLRRFDHVIAVEPDGRMAEKITPHEKLEIIITHAETFDINPRSVDLITCASAFYWMDGPALVERMATWIHPDGLIAVYRYGVPVLPARVHDIMEREFREHWNAYRSPRLIDEEYSWRCFSQSMHVRHANRQIIPNVIKMDGKSLTGFFSSTSYCSAYMRSIADASAYLSSLGNEISAASSGTSFDVDFSIELITASIMN